ncbi:alpha/beta hydrolase [Nocardia crassostreae]|uniref:alpha/beta hydrolase n=1 Tax=Nocardia crassostreae TaxID=53428 RepID=UPI00082A1828|nr:alpha/beta hydrolase [Nocardia crassostreae]
MVAVAGAILLAAACGSNTTPAPTAGAGVEKYQQQRVEWGSCQEFSDYGDKLGEAGLECARIDVTLDYGKPDGETARIALSRLAAGGERIGSLVTNPGGPGMSGLALPLAFAQTELAQRFDLIGMDPRGLGASTPKVVCRTAEEFQAERVDLDTDYSAAGIAQTERENQELVDNCVERSGLEVLRNVGTRDVARDLDIVRAVLGDEKLTYFGGSYGTRLGSVYAEMYPDRVRAMVLDGAVDPGTNILDPVNSSRSFQQAFETYAADCAKQPDCPLGTDPDPAKTSAELRELLQSLIDRPATTENGRGLGYRDAGSGVLNSLYTPEGWTGITKGLTELRQGRGDTLLGIADLIEASTGLERDLQQAVLCLDDKRVTDRAEANDLFQQGNAAASAFDHGRATTGAVPLEVCAFWPVPPTYEPHALNISGLPKTVVVSTTGDPATPYQNGINLARDLGATLITFEGNQHGVFGSGVTCVDTPVIDYLINLTPPAEGLRCTAP